MLSSGITDTLDSPHRLVHPAQLRGTLEAPSPEHVLITGKTSVIRPTLSMTRHSGHDARWKVGDISLRGLGSQARGGSPNGRSENRFSTVHRLNVSSVRQWP